MIPKHFYQTALCCILTLLSACKDDNNSPLRFYNDTYEVPMGGIRYLGLESGNGDYSLEVKDQRLVSAQVEQGWSTPGGSAIYVRGILTGKTTLKVTDYATLESCLLTIKVVDNYETMRLSRGYGSSLSENGTAEMLPGISDMFLINNRARDAYFFKQGPQTAFSSGLVLVAKGNYVLEPGMDDQANMTLTFTESVEHAEALTGSHKFILHGNPYILHRLDKNLNLNWDIARASSFLHSGRRRNRKAVGLFIHRTGNAGRNIALTGKNTVGSDVRFVITGCVSLRANIRCEYATPADKGYWHDCLYSSQNRGEPIYK